MKFTSNLICCFLIWAFLLGSGVEISRATETIEDHSDTITEPATQPVEQETPEKDVDEGAAVQVPDDQVHQDLAETFKVKEAQPFEIIGHTVAPGTTRTLEWPSLQSPLGKRIEIPVIVVNGAKPGPVLVMTSAIHGDELNGIEINRRFLHELNPKRLKGVVIGVPIVNLEGFWRKERYLGDRKDLNRYFPGNESGSHPSRIAHSLFTTIVQRGDMVIDLHTGSFYRENLPQLRVDLTVPQVAELVTGFGAVTALHSVAPAGSLRGAATDAGIPTIVMEIGGPLSLETDKVEVGLRSIRSFLQSVGMLDKITLWPSPQPVFYESEWVRSNSGGILINKVQLGESVKKGALLAEISNPLDNTTVAIHSPVAGTILGRAQNQFVSPGFALFHIGHKRSLEELEQGLETSRAENEGTDRDTENIDQPVTDTATAETE
ncbi:succinylglutamate desuccinylase/aspartoacylase family protein [Desulfosediminicola ganghwensis]|uniref:succinylglutamate desuccinylase/aspartoacylase family protein n=1 Tax=Desulfosediminicola ganghwensis TaxID=2569540 RepID=UPI00142F1C05|nr:succinylglutamate desuccinylase/aspartoacylase family protein [Desulfosediminicola ganghwensis]